MEKRTVGVVGFGHLGQYLVDQIQKQPNLELAFVWNRNISALFGKVEPDNILTNLLDFKDFGPDLIVEVAHPSVTHEYGAAFLAAADFMIGSPTAMAAQETEAALRQAAQVHGLYVPSGAFWGGEDIKKMADRGTLQALKVTMKKHPTSFKLEGELAELNKSVMDNPVILYEGSVRGLCPLAPNNVNTMATAAIAAHNLGFDHVQGCLVSDPSLVDWHIVEVEAWGPGDMKSGKAFRTHTVRHNPAATGAVTGSATYESFLSSLLGAHSKGPGVHLC
ncbi:putative L-aspartate dehydrogenase [Pomacea canaliculata]|uniref:putative L-aspartate dehydrogenase n=1 Tax=Pomacea canaliculata TaxID=400727 RepID=UPI000D73B113|nr:putative L-aspartate dehydrogenase [Pomacea canaliculata]